MMPNPAWIAKISGLICAPVPPYAPAALWCSECESWYLAEYVPAYGAPCSPNLTYQNTSGVQVVNVEQDTIDKKRNGETMVCPLCGAQTQLRNVQELRYGRAAQDFIAVPTVAEKLPSINAVVH